MPELQTSDQLSDECIRTVARTRLLDERATIPADAIVERHDGEMSSAAFVEADVAGLPDCALYLWVSLEDATANDSTGIGTCARADKDWRTP